MLKVSPINNHSADLFDMENESEAAVDAKNDGGAGVAQNMDVQSMDLFAHEKDTEAAAVDDADDEGAAVEQIIDAHMDVSINASDDDTLNANFAQN